MQALGRFIGNAVQHLNPLKLSIGNSVVSEFTGNSMWSTQQVRYKVRRFFEKPSELKRIRKHGYYKRISTEKGRKVVMKRILHGRHVLTH